MKIAKNDDAEFLQKFADATPEQLARAGVSPSEKYDYRNYDFVAANPKVYEELRHLGLV